MLKSIYRFLSPKFQNIFLDYKVDMRPRYGHGLPAHKGLYEIINAHRSDYELILKEALKYKEQFWIIKDSSIEKDSISLPGIMDFAGAGHYCDLCHFSQIQTFKIY
ncbi:MAG: hypothetical protein IPF67_08160 [Saprospiraceae bacterium]|nr:hypothetical protein [Candidatus Brachybacter algidus]